MNIMDAKITIQKNSNNNNAIIILELLKWNKKQSEESKMSVNSQQSYKLKFELCVPLLTMVCVYAVCDLPLCYFDFWLCFVLFARCVECMQ